MKTIEFPQDIHDVIVISSRGRVGRKIGPIGFITKEVIGMAIINPRGIAAGRKSTIIK